MESGRLFRLFAFTQQTINATYTEGLQRAIARRAHRDTEGQRYPEK